MNKERFYIKNLQPIREFCLNSDKEDVYKYIYSLQQENEKLNHYKLLYQKVKERNDKAIEYIKSNLKYAINPDGVDEPYLDCYECRDLLEILKGKNEE